MEQKEKPIPKLMRFEPKEFDESNIPAPYREAMHIWQSKQLIDVIVKKMRMRDSAETFAPEPGKTYWFKGVSMPPSGGIFSKYEGVPERKGFSHADTVEKIADIKRVVVAFLYGFINVRGKWLIGLFYLLFRNRLKESFWRMVWQLRKMILVHLIHPARYCISVREIYKAFKVFKEERMKWVRDIVCMTLEFDDAYRYRFQDVIGEFSPDLFKQNPEKEIKRIVHILLEREEDPRINNMWKKIGSVITLMLITHRHELISFFAQIRPENIRMDDNDFYYAKTKPGYQWYRNNAPKINLLP